MGFGSNKEQTLILTITRWWFIACNRTGSAHQMLKLSWMLRKGHDMQSSQCHYQDDFIIIELIIVLKNFRTRFLLQSPKSIMQHRTISEVHHFNDICTQHCYTYNPCTYIQCLCYIPQLDNTPATWPLRDAGACPWNNF